MVFLKPAIMKTTISKGNGGGGGGGGEEEEEEVRGSRMRFSLRVGDVWTCDLRKDAFLKQIQPVFSIQNDKRAQGGHEKAAFSNIMN